MSFNNRNLNPNIWDCRNSQPFGNNSPNFFGSNTSGGNFPRPNFNPQHQSIPNRPLLNVNVPPPHPQEHQHELRKFNNRNHNQDFNRNYRPGPAGRNNSNFSNPPNPQKWQNKRREERNDSNSGSGGGERFKHDNVIEILSSSSIASAANDVDSRPKSLVEQLKSTMKKTTSRNTSSQETTDSINACAQNASKKLLSQLKTMDTDNVKELINNPRQPHRKAVMSIQAREKLREVSRKQMKTLGAAEEQEVTFDVEESVNCESIPETLIAQIGRTVDIELGVEDMDLQNDMEDEPIVDKEMEVVETNLGNDFLFGSEMLLMNGFSLLGENEQEGDPDDTRFSAPPLPSEPVAKPPEPVPPVGEACEAAFSSSNKPWTVAPPKPPLPPVSQRVNDDSKLNSARNPDPPNDVSLPPPPVPAPLEAQPIQVIVSQPPPLVTQKPPPTVIVPETIVVQNTTKIDVTKKPPPSESPLLAAVKKLPETPLHASGVATTTMAAPSPQLTSVNSNIVSTAPMRPISDESVCPTPAPFTDLPEQTTPNAGRSLAEVGNLIMQAGTALANSNNNTAANHFSESEQQQKPEQRANETYGDYRRRLAGLEPAANRQLPQQQQQQRKDIADDDDRMSRTSENSNPWMRNSNNSSTFKNERKSRFEMNREKNKNRNDRRSFVDINTRGGSRDRNQNQWNTRRDERVGGGGGGGSVDENVKDAFNYRFNSSNAGSGDVDPDRLNSILNPKPVQFKGSFNKRTGFNSNISRDYRRSLSRERTPVNNSVEREFGEASNAVPDARPCYHTLKKIIEIDTELSKAHDKIHGIDKVIANLQSERVGHQKTVMKLSHDRKVLFDNLLKRSMNNENRSPSERSEPKEKKEKRNRLLDDDEDETVVVNPSPAPSTPCKIVSQKKLQEFDQKKRKTEEVTPQREEEPKKMKKFALLEEPKSAQQKQREQEEKDRLKRIEEIRRLKQQRREREAAAQRLLEQQAIKESNDVIPVIKKEKPDKSSDKTKSKQTQQQQHANSSKDEAKKANGVASSSNIQRTDTINPADYKIKKMHIKLASVTLDQAIVEQYKAHSYPEISVEDWLKWSSRESATVKAEKPHDHHQKEKEKDSVASSVKKEEKNPKPAEPEKDPLAIDDVEMENPPTTPGNHLTMDDEEASLNNDDQDYSEWTGSFNEHTSPIVFLLNVDGRYMVCASESGKLYKYRLKTGKCEGIFSKHSEICNSFLYNEKEKSIYTASSDGKSYRIGLKTFESSGLKSLGEALQIIEKSKYALYIGSKSGKIYKLKFDLTGDLEPLCCVDAFLLCMKASKEGSRHILIVSSRNNAIQIRDANEGLLLRTLSKDLANVNIYDMLIEGSTIYCGSNLHEIFAIDFTTGALKSKRTMSGAGAICVKLYKDHLIAACYDGNIYIFNINSDDDAVNIAGPSKMILAMDLWDDKIIASTKDTTLKIMNIPT